VGYYTAKVLFRKCGPQMTLTLVISRLRLNFSTFKL
jgi:hypothetical protein